MPHPLERKSWIASIVGTIISIGALTWSIWTYVKAPESPPQPPAASAINSGSRAVIIQGNGNTVLTPSVVEAVPLHSTPRYVEFSISDQSLDLPGKKRHEVHFPKLTGPVAPDILARSNHNLKRIALTAYERFANRDEVSIAYKIGFKEFNLLGINYNIFIDNDNAAHPNTTTNAVVLNLETGSEFELKDLFRAGYMAQLNKLVRANLKKQEQYFSCDGDKGLDAKMQEALKTVRDTLKDIYGHESNTCFSSVSDNGQYYLTDTSLVLVFPKYSIAPGASGDVEAPINFNALHGILNPKGPLSRFL